MAECRGSISNAILAENIKCSKILVVGAGGIGCELLKNLVLTGFRDICVIDLDTIDVSNLNRQFLFRKEHVGLSKAEVARESALKYNPEVKIQSIYDSILSSDYGVPFFRQFTIVMNALDNRQARNHVNRMCLAADVPLIESGSAGYLGQVSVIKKAVTECYECLPQTAEKTYPGCTIRNTPSAPIHCIVWAKHLFNQLFGEEDPDEDVSPDTEDPELTASAGQNALNNQESNILRKSTRLWAKENGYDPMKLFNKLFRDDINYLLSMKDLWKKRRPPVPQHWDLLYELAETSNNQAKCEINDQVIWTILECAQVFSDCLFSLKKNLENEGEGGILCWDKDDDVAMDFVTAAANLRAHIFGIPLKSRFDVKSMAGNIIPAIATTNSIIAGLICMQAMNILSGNIRKCKRVLLNKEPNWRKRIFLLGDIAEPNPNCYVCSPKPEVTVMLNTDNVTVRTLKDKILKSHIGMVAPDVEIDDGYGSIVISSEEGETEDNEDKTLSHFNINDGVRLKCEDFLQNYKLVVNIAYSEKFDNDVEFQLAGNLDDLKTEIAKSANFPETRPSDTVQSEDQIIEEDDDLIMMSDEEEDSQMDQNFTKKRKADFESELDVKRTKLYNHDDDQTQDAVIIL